MGWSGVRQGKAGRGVWGTGRGASGRGDAVAGGRGRAGYSSVG